MFVEDLVRYERANIIGCESEPASLDLELEDEGEKYVQDPQNMQAVYDTIALDDTVGLYFREVGRVELLDAEQEVELAKRIEAGREAKVESQSGDLTSEEQDRLGELVADGLAARDHLIRANTRLVISVANRYKGRGVPFLDLIQEGTIGLIKTADKYDYRRGNRFSTYATWWIRQAVTRAIADQGRTIRLPVHRGDQIYHLRRATQALSQRTGRDPTLDELSEEMDMPTDKVEEIMRISRRPISLSEPADDQGETELGDFIEDDELQTPEDLVTSERMQEVVHGILEDLPPRELRILQLRYGLVDGQTRTLEQVGQQMGVSRERVRQIECQALRRLRHPARRRQLKGFLN
jgi:RNA polymerase primary sigma factor